jgi:hypothetical protein
MGAEHYPVPWRVLRHDSELDGYRSDISGNRLKGYPKSVFGSSGSELFDWTAKRGELDSYYDNVDTVTTKEGAENPIVHGMPGLAAGLAALLCHNGSTAISD